MGVTTSYWQKERWSRRAADTLTSYGRCWNPSLGNWDVNRRVGILSEEQTPQVFVFFSQRSGQRKSRAGCSRFSEPFGSTRFELRLVSWTLLGTAVVLFVTVVLPARIHSVLDKECSIPHR